MNLQWRLSHIRGYLALGMVRHAEAEMKAVRPEYAELSEVKALQVTLLHEKKSWRQLRRIASALVEREPHRAEW